MRFNNQRADKNAKWNNSDLNNLLKGHPKNIADIIGNICLCNNGEPTYYFEVESMYEEFSLPDTVLLIADKSD